MCTKKKKKLSPTNKYCCTSSTGSPQLFLPRAASSNLSVNPAYFLFLIPGRTFFFGFLPFVFGLRCVSDTLLLFCFFFVISCFVLRVPAQSETLPYYLCILYWTLLAVCRTAVSVLPLLLLLKLQSCGDCCCITNEH